jgi:hypothetical protein
VHNLGAHLEQLVYLCVKAGSAHGDLPRLAPPRCLLAERERATGCNSQCCGLVGVKVKLANLIDHTKSVLVVSVDGLVLALGATAPDDKHEQSGSDQLCNEDAFSIGLR